ncbi:hypothetical protein [Rhodopila sp.]|uniref:hypothetical protein n=1 Tax=Rhodopila sp. TaxID=2480087 RepID=UPI003D127AA0
MAKQVPGGQFLALNSGHFAPVQTPALVAQAMHAYLHAVGLDRQDFGGRILAADLMAAGFWRLVHDLVRLAGRVAGCAA